MVILRMGGHTYHFGVEMETKEAMIVDGTRHLSYIMAQQVLMFIWHIIQKFE